MTGEHPLTTRDVGAAQDVLRQDESALWSRRRDLLGARWRAGFVPLIPYLFADGDTGRPFGFQYELWLQIAADLNVTSELAGARFIGELGEDGRQWTGVVGMVQREEVDLSLSAVSMTLARSKEKKKDGSTVLPVCRLKFCY